MTIKYCQKCVMSNTKPRLQFDENGVCFACKNHELKKQINWNDRFDKLIKLSNEIKAKHSEGYQVIVPVSGGKDSIVQVKTAVKDLGLKVLAVNVDYGIKTDIGRFNLDLIPKIGCDLITFRPNLAVHKQLMKEAFLETGTPDTINHPLLYCYPIHLALQLKIPLVMFGENPAFEYTGEADNIALQTINQDWYNKHISYNNDFMDSIVYKYGYSLLKYYMLPVQIKRTKIVFLGDYIFWDSYKNYETAKQFGFATNGRRVGTYRDYSGIDEEIHYLHQRIKFLSFSYGRCTDHACEDLRNGRLNRKEAFKLILKYDNEEIEDKILLDFCDYINITKKELLFQINKRTNSDLIIKSREKIKKILKEDYNEVV